MKPQLEYPAADGDTIRMRFSVALDQAASPPASAFTVLVDGVVTPVIGVELVSSWPPLGYDTVQLTLATPVIDGQIVGLSYTDPTSGDDAAAIQDLTGEDADSFSHPFIPNETDEISPTVTITVDDDMLTAGETAQVTIIFSERPSNFDPAAIIVANGGLSDLAHTPDYLVWTATFTPTGDGACAIEILPGSYMDATLRPGGGGRVAFDAEISSPTVVATTADPLLAAGEDAVVTLTFSEPPVGFGADDIALENGVLLSLEATDDPLVYVAVCRPSAEGMVLVGFGPERFADEAGNQGGGCLLQLTADFTPPGSLVQLEGDGVLAAGQSTQVRLAFGEAPVGFAPEDLFAVNGVVSGFSATDDPRTYTAVFTASAAGPVQLEILGASFADEAGNPGWGSSLIPATDPDVAWALIRMDDSTLRAGQAAQLTFAFLEEPVGLAANDIAVVNGALSGFTMVTPHVYAATFTPAASGAASVTVPAGSYADSAAVAHFWADLVTPIVAVTTEAETLFPRSRATITFTFSEAPAGFTAADVTTVNGAISGLAVTGDPRVYTALFTPSDVGAAAVKVVAGSYADGFGNPGSAGGATLSVEAPPRPPPPPPPPSGPSEGPDVIRLPGAGGTVSGGGGDDWIAGAASSDWMHGNTGRDTLTADDGADTAMGGRDDDWLHGNPGDDMVFGDVGDDVVHGGQGADHVQGNAGNDTVAGDRGDDRVYGGKGDDMLSGGDGGDWLFGDLGDDYVVGGAGADRFCFTDGAAGHDVIADFSRADGDVLWISPTLAAGFEDLIAHVTASAAGDAVITLGAQTIVLAGVGPSNLAAADFLFG